jgi:RHS repeat-associated protein
MKALVALLLLAASSAVAAPTVSMTAPTSGNLYLAPATFAVKANASAPGVGVNRVEFYANGALVGTDTTSPYQFDWTGVPAGSYSITAKAVDNNGAETTSAPRTVTVSGTNAAPTVSLTAPADNARYLSPSSITLSANAAGPELNDLLQKVEFFVNGTLAGTATSAPWSFSWQNPALGTYTLTAVATDSQGAQTTSSARTVIVTDQNQAPAVSIVTPLDSSRWHAPASFMFQANASSGEANDIVRVEFYLNGALQGQDTAAPYSINLSSLAAGTYTLMARAIDGQSAQTDSAARTITVSDTNAAPTVTISAPAPGANFPSAPASFALSASAGAGEVNGWVTKVEFFVNGALVATDTAGPWSFNVSGLANGSYTLTAKAFDQLNAETLSAPVTVTVGPLPKLHFVHVDHLNTPRLITNDQQQAVWRWDQQEPFGVNGPDENPSALGVFEFPLRFPGQYADRETNLFYNYFRDYDPSLGRYEEGDPIGLHGGINLYAYANSAPTINIDPLGLDIRIGVYPGIYASGHVGIGLVGPDGAGTVGFNPVPGAEGNVFTGIPGRIFPDNPSELIREIIITTKPWQDRCIEQCINDWTANPGMYRVTRRNCRDFVDDCLRRCDITSSRIRPGPRPYFDDLARRCKGKDECRP